MIIVKVILTFIHVLVSIFLVIAILLQAAKGGGLSGTFGGANTTSSVFGARGTATALATITQYLAGGFLVLSFVLSFMAGGGQVKQSVTQQVLEATPASQLPPVEELNFDTDEGGAVEVETAPVEGTDSEE